MAGSTNKYRAIAHWVICLEKLAPMRAATLKIVDHINVWRVKGGPRWKITAQPLVNWKVGAGRYKKVLFLIYYLLMEASHERTYMLSWLLEINSLLHFDHSLVRVR